MLMTTWNNGCERTRFPGILRTRTGYRVRVRAVDPRTGMLKERNEHFAGITQEQAIREQAKLKADKLKLEVAAVPGTEMQELVEQLYGSPPDVIELVKKINSAQ